MAGSWFGMRRKIGGEKVIKDHHHHHEEEEEEEDKSAGGKKGQVLDGSGIQELVQNEASFNSFAESKFRELDVNQDGKLSVKELEPAVANIGAVLGLPAQGTSPESDHIYAEVLNEFTLGKHEEVSKSEFKEVLSDILLGMAAGLEREPIWILRIDGEDLKEFINSGDEFEREAVSIFSGITVSADQDANLKGCLIMALDQLTVDQGMPPSSDPWVTENIVEPAFGLLQSDFLDHPASEEVFLEQFKKLLDEIRGLLEENPTILAHSSNIYDGSGIERLLANKFELDKHMDNIWRDLPKDDKHKTSWKDYVRFALDRIAASIDLPSSGAVEKVDAIVNEAIKKLDADSDGKVVEEEEFKKTMTQVLGGIMLQLQGNPITVTSNTVLHVTSSAIFPLPEPPTET